MEDEVVLILAGILSADDGLAADLAGTRASLAARDDETLWRLARCRVAGEDAAWVAALGDKRQRVGLTD